MKCLFQPPDQVGTVLFALVLGAAAGCAHAKVDTREAAPPSITSTGGPTKVETAPKARKIGGLAAPPALVCRAVPERRRPPLPSW